MIGPVPRNELHHYYRRASALVLPSIAEGLPNVIMEALACGLPVITTPTGGDELVTDGHTGYVVPVGNSSALAATLLRLLAPGEIERLKCNVALRRTDNATTEAQSRLATLVVGGNR
jgi:glycosyltransferase involved in cell wall biosynthesis